MILDQALDNRPLTTSKCDGLKFTMGGGFESDVDRRASEDIVGFCDVVDSECIEIGLGDLFHRELWSEFLMQEFCLRRHDHVLVFHVFCPKRVGEIISIVTDNHLSFSAVDAMYRGECHVRFHLQDDVFYVGRGCF